ncbi:MAG: MFS transporter [Verrucomicrobia bacterium]|nr:MFS transporter [Verrucomicrobiota bacterium]
MSNPVINYFSEFKVLKSASKDFWLTNAIQFCDGLAYFSMITVLSIYLTTNCGFNDVDSGAWFGIYMLYVTAFMFAVGSICDVIGIRKSYFIGFALLALSRLGLGVAPVLLHGETLQWVVKGMLIIMSLGTAFIAPVTMTSLRRYTTKQVRATGFNVYYLMMNVGAIIANALIVDGFTRIWGEVAGKLAILDFGFLMSLCAVACAALLKEDNYAEDSERASGANETKRPLGILLEVWKERAFQRLLLFLVLTIGVRLVFTNQMLVMPKYYTRVLYSDFELGLASSINPFIIVVGLIAIIPVINRFATVRLIIIGMAISAFSLVFVALPLDWVLRVPGIHNVTQAYLLVIVAQIVVFAFGELIFMPRFTEYIASVSPPDKVSSYMALAALPMFIAKPINGFVSGILISRFCYDGIRPKIETGNLTFGESPEFMWVIYLVLALMSPLAVIALRNFLTHRPVLLTATSTAGRAP